jgi:class 3 adenylate cyclase
MSPTADGASADLQQTVAELQRQLAEARTERDEVEGQKAALAEILVIINSSPGDLTPVFDAILEQAHRSCGADLGCLAVYEGKQFRAVATHNYPPEYAALVRQPYGAEASVYARLVDGERYIHIPDVVAVPTPGLENAIRLTAIDVAGIRTVLLVPLRKEGAFLGYFSAQRREVRPYSEREITLIESFAAQAVIAMENARLMTETREALEQQTATAEVLEVINSSPGDLMPVFDSMLEKATRLCGVPYGQLALFDGDSFRFVAVHGEHPFERHQPRDPKPPSWGVTWPRLVAGEDVVHMPDVVDSEIYRSGHETTRHFVEIGGGRSLLTVALRKNRQLLGGLTVYSQQAQPFSDKQIGLLQNFAAQAVIAMENARLLNELRERNEEIAGWNRDLETRVAEQVEELSRVGRLKRFLAPQLAELIVSQGDEKILQSHRREIVVVFCDLRGYTAFNETAEPEEVLDFLREYHGALGPLVSQFEGTLDQFSGDGIMVFFNDPVPIPDPAERAVKMAVAMREAASTLVAALRERGRELGFGAGIAQGYATLGQIGFSERSGYTAIGTVCNVAARLCGEAKDGQILLSQRVNVALKGSTATEQVGALTLKGLTQPVVTYNVPLTVGQPALRVIDGGNH